ncbi:MULTISPECIES: bacteriocin BlpN [unclassified Streptococcus]|uniref:bacteriocin BlpN n=1 Tax=unclassified Streptococcus TaxID=2608887 RepID=UPI0018ABA846|nr:MULTISPECIES: bacteriocin BlpN [unclassified Streptococcus]MBF8969813.1 bacteriocin BlpN [Streptococcus sp. NLN76]MBG9366702.1 bacteriocin BlpN [Streptococcus sp. NLN64]
MVKLIKIENCDLITIYGGNAAGAAVVAGMGCIKPGIKLGASVGGFWGGVIGGVGGAGICGYLAYTASS